MKHWSFDTCAIAGFAFSSLAVLLLVVNAIAAIVPVGILIPVAGVLLLVGGAFSVRAHFLRYSQSKSKKLR